MNGENFLEDIDIEETEPEVKKKISLPLPEIEVFPDTCLFCGMPTEPTESFCRDECKIDYHFSGIEPEIKEIYKRQMTRINKMRDIGGHKNG